MEDFGEHFFSFSPRPRTTKSCFALLLTFETGKLTVHPFDLENVMAICSGDSLFVATQLLVDSSEFSMLKLSSIHRIRGNIGRSGIGMMVPPPELQVK